MGERKISCTEHLSSEARWLLALDPGSPDVGVALFASGVLIQAAHVKIKRKQDIACPMCQEECRHQIESQTTSELCDAIETWIDLVMGKDKRPAIVLSEQPQAFQHKRGGQIIRHHAASDRSILLCYGVMAAVLDRAIGWGARAFQYTPAKLKGAMSKEQFQKRSMMIFSPVERNRIERRPCAGDLNSDAADAASIGLTWLLRTGYRGRR